MTCSGGSTGVHLVQGLLMLSPQEIRVVAFVLAVLLVGWVVKACRQPVRLIEDPHHPGMEEVQFKKNRRIDAPD